LNPDDLYHDFCTGLADLEPDLNRDPKQCHSFSAIQTEFLSSEEVQKAVNAWTGTTRSWTVCNQTGLNYTISYKPIPEILKDIFAAKLHVLY